MGEQNTILAAQLSAAEEVAEKLLRDLGSEKSAFATCNQLLSNAIVEDDALLIDGFGAVAIWMKKHWGEKLKLGIECDETKATD